MTWRSLWVSRWRTMWLAIRLEYWMSFWRLGLGQRPRVDAAIRAPMAAMERHRQRTFAQQIVKGHDMPLLVGHGERRHWIAGLRGCLAGIVRLQAADHSIHGLLISRDQISRRLAEGLKPLVQGCIHVAAIEEGLFEGGESRMSHALAPLPPARPDLR
jgi:hypothetical protein